MSVHVCVCLYSVSVCTGCACDILNAVLSESPAVSVRSLLSKKNE